MPRKNLGTLLVFESELHRQEIIYYVIKWNNFLSFVLQRGFLLSLLVFCVFLVLSWVPSSTDLGFGCLPY